MNKYPKGSEWNKWDLHLHCPNTKLNNDYKVSDKEDTLDKFCTTLEESDVVGFGITDYFSADNYYTFMDRFKAKYPDSIKIFFPNIELRLEVSVNKKAEEVNIHIIFSDKVTSKQINSFLSKLDTNLKKNGALLTCNDLSVKTEYESASVDHKRLKKILVEVFGDEDCYLIFAASNNAGIRPDNGSPRKLNITNEIDRICDGFFGGQQNREYFLDINRYKDGSTAKQKPSVTGCDAHSFSELNDWLGKRITKVINNNEVIEKDVTWIKADLSFEGLKQIIYEPDTRIVIGDKRPKSPINTLDSITLNISDNTKVGNDAFCFAGVNNNFYLSPYFNCFIGGRGSGKSTILNFLGLFSNNPESSRIFWFGNGKDKEGITPIGFSPDNKTNFSFEGTEIFEYLAQSEIETFAKDKIKFTQAIYDRANGPGKILQKYEDDISECQNELNKVICAVSDLRDLDGQKKEKEKEKRSLENTKNIIESKDYKKISDSISKLTQKTQVHKKWSSEIDLFKTQINDTVEFYERNNKGNKDQILYKDSFLLAIEKIKEAMLILNEDNFIEQRKEEKSLQNNLIILEGELKKLLDKGSFSEDNIQQIKAAPQKIVSLEREIEQINSQIDSKKIVIRTLDNIVAKLKTNKKSYEDKITDIINPLQKLLEKQFQINGGKNIKKISLEYSFDEDRAWDLLTNEFYETFKGLFKDKENGKDVCRYIIDSKDLFRTEKFSLIQDNVLQNTKNGTQYIKFISEVFKDENNYQIFRAIRDKYLFDVKKYKIIKVKYDNRDVDQASFGQRCTAVVVILLLFGNNPLIIDEPEAHLDSSLIANYLVPLLKEKKLDRQIIFATHNANFVINGDAEKIFILRNDSGKTDIIETTIEDNSNREELLKLEGGQEAFEKRGEKLNIHLS